MKRIVLCFDGTWNTPAEAGIRADKIDRRRQDAALDYHPQNEGLPALAGRVEVLPTTPSEQAAPA